MSHKCKVSVIAAAMVVSAVATGVPAASADTAPSRCGAGWTRTQTPSPGAIGTILLDVAAVSSSEAWAVGYRAYPDPDGMFAVSSIIERWDGSAWTLARKPAAQGQLAGAVAFADDDVWAVGHTGLESPDFQPLIMHWDGADWAHVPSPDVETGYLLAVGGVATDDLWAAGMLIGTGDTFIEHWDGSAWTLVPHPSPSSDYVAIGGIAAAASDDVTIVGTYLHDDQNAPLALHWDGSAWHRTRPQAVGDRGTSLADVTVTSSGAVWAVGSYVASAGGETQPVVQRWTGHRWSTKNPSSLDGSASLASVTAGPGGLWAVGSQTTADQTSTLTERWRARAHEWHVVASPNARGDNSLLAADEAPDGEVWAVGYHINGTLQQTLAMHRCAAL